MINEDQLRKDTARATRAKQLLEDELINEAFAQLEADYLKKWRETTAPDAALREKYWLAVRVVGVVRDHLHNTVANGKLAEKELSDFEKLAEPRRRFGLA